MPRRLTEETPFSMTYGAKAIIPLEIGFLTLRTSSFSLSSNNELLEKSLNLIKEKRDSAMVQLAYFLSIKYNLSYVKLFGLYTLVKLTLNDIYLFFVSVKQNLNYVRLFGPHTLVKLTLNDIYLFLLSVKYNLSYVRLLEPHTLVKLILNDIYSLFLSVKQNLSYVRLLGPYTLVKLTLNNIYLFLTKCQDKSKIITNSLDW